MSRIYESEEVNTISIEEDNSDKWYTKMCKEIKINENNYPQWKLRDNLLYKLVPSNIPVESNIPEWKIVVPKHQRQKIMKLCHETSTCGHLGSFKTFFRVKELYYWPKMRVDINKFIKQCKI